MLTLRSPAKLNLFLQVVSRREDGYHNLASLFQAIELYDTIHFQLSKEDRLTCNVPEIPLNETNLILKAVSLFRQKTGLSFGIHIKLEKNIPIQAGLGGGSSNAATTLWALNALLGAPAKMSDLVKWSADVGSDVPFFFSSGTAYCTGRGECVLPLDPLPPCPLWIVKPRAGLPTPAVFKNLNLNELNQRDSGTLAKRFGKGEAVYFNDLEAAAFSILPELKRLKMSLIGCGFEAVLMTGSGSAFFCIGNGVPSVDEPFIKKTQFINREVDSWY